MADWIGHTYSKVEVQKLLGTGGMAQVYLGRHTTLNRPVAVKVLHSYLVEDPQLLDRFRNEARAVAGLRHPNIVQVFDFDVVDGSPYMVMELLEGRSLADYLAAQRTAGKTVTPATTARLMADLASALDYAHSRGIIHRDIKPENIMLRRASGPIDPTAPLPPDAEAVLTDFGIARISDSKSRTVTGTIAGTPAYMSPEQASGTPVDGRSDIYSLGIVLYEMLTGRTPFAVPGTTTAAILVKHITTAPPPLPCNCPELQAVVTRALAKDRAARYQTATEMAIDLQKALGVGTMASRTHPLRPVSRNDLGANTGTMVAQPAARKPIPWPMIVGIGLVVIFLAIALISTGGAAIILGAHWLSAKSALPMPGATSTNLGNLGFRSGAQTDDKVLVSAQLPALPAKEQYEVWLLSSDTETRLSIGYLAADGTLAYVDPQGRNLVGLYNGFEITVQPKPDTSPNPSGKIVAHNSLPPGTLAHIRHVLTLFPGAPGQVGLVVGLEKDAELVNATAQTMQSAQQQGDLAGVRQSAEAMINTLVGKNSPDYGDSAGVGQVVDPSDGFGLLLNGDNVGYIQGTSDHAKMAAEASDATAAAKMHSVHVEICAQNLNDWAGQLLGLDKQIVASTTLDAAAPSVAKVVSLSKVFINGQDLNGDESVDPVPGEGGAKTALEHAQYMADLPLLPGPGQTP